MTSWSGVTGEHGRQRKQSSRLEGRLARCWVRHADRDHGKVMNHVGKLNDLATSG